MLDYYSTFQVLVILHLAGNLGIIDKVNIYVNDREVNVPLTPIMRELGI